MAGKPYRPLLDDTVSRLGAHHPLFVGDRLDTDIAGAVNAGLDSMLVLLRLSSRCGVVRRRSRRTTNLCRARSPCAVAASTGHQPERRRIPLRSGECLGRGGPARRPAQRIERRRGDLGRRPVPRGGLLIMVWSSTPATRFGNLSGMITSSDAAVAFNAALCAPSAGVSGGRKASIVSEAFQTYINMVTGVTRSTQAKASATARALFEASRPGRCGRGG